MTCDQDCVFYKPEGSKEHQELDSFIKIVEVDDKA